MADDVATYFETEKKSAQLRRSWLPSAWLTRRASPEAGLQGEAFRGAQATKPGVDGGHWGKNPHRM